MTQKKRNVQPTFDGLTPSLSWHVRRNLKTWRKEAGGFASAGALAERMTELGVPTGRDTIAALETRARERPITLEELAAMSLALGVPPVDLVLPLDDAERVAVAAGHDNSGSFVRAWWRGDSTLPTSSAASDRESFHRELLMFQRKSPWYVQRSQRQGLAREVVNLREFETFLLDALDALARDGHENGVSQNPRGFADALRRTSRRIAQQAEALAKDLEHLADQQEEPSP